MRETICRMLLAALPLVAGTVQADEMERQAGTISFGTQSIMQYLLTPPHGPAIEYFLSKPDHPAPLVLYIQGSGCTPVFTGLGTEHRASTVFSYLSTVKSGKYAVMVVNKPYSPKERVGDGGTATACPPAFNDYFTVENWVRDLRLAVGQARRMPWVDARRTLVIGVSEGATVAAALAAQDGGVSHVALLGASGPTQLYDFIVAAYKSSSNDDDVTRRLDELEATRRRIAALPDSATEFAWGHPYKRWTSFFQTSSTVNLLHSQARIYLASGMQDASVPILSTESMYSELLTSGHDVTMRRVPHAEHSLLPPDVSYEQLQPEYQRVLDWFDSPGQ